MSKDIPCLGIFWFSPELNKLIGVKKLPINFVTIKSDEELLHNTLHKTEWKNFSKYDNVTYHGHYKLMPRGRILYYRKFDKYIIGVGDWIDKYPQAIEMIKAEFCLNNANVEVRKCPHWNAGFLRNLLWQFFVRLPLKIFYIGKKQPMFKVYN